MPRRTVYGGTARLYAAVRRARVRRVGRRGVPPDPRRDGRAECDIGGIDVSKAPPRRKVARKGRMRAELPELPGNGLPRESPPSSVTCGDSFPRGGSLLAQQKTGLLHIL